MTRLLWFFAWVAVAVWSLVAWSAYGLIDLFGGLAQRGADAVTDHPAAAGWLAWTFGWLQSLGQTATLAVWLMGSLAILAVPFVLSRLVGRTHPVPYGQAPHRGQVIDLTPDQYSSGAPRSNAGSGRDLARPFDHDRRPQ